VTEPGGAVFPLESYFSDLKTLYSSPSRFFKTISVDQNIAYPIAFGLISHWIGSSVNYLWSFAYRQSDVSWIDRMALLAGRGREIEALGNNARWLDAKQRLSGWLTGMGSVVLDPFTTLFWIFITSALLFISARLFVGAVSDTPLRPARLREVTFQSSFRIVSFAQAAYLLSMIPFAGKPLSLLAAIAFTTIGTRELYNVSSGRALLIVLFPRLLTVLLVFAIFALLIVGLFSLFFST
jgi:hypothetical protein